MEFIKPKAVPETKHHLIYNNSWIVEDYVEGVPVMVSVDEIMILDGRVEVTNKIPHITSILEERPLTIFLGILTHPEGKRHLEDILRMNDKTALEEQQETGYIRLVVYDLLYDDERRDLSNLPYLERRTRMIDVFNHLENDINSSYFLSVGCYFGDRKPIALAINKKVILKNINKQYKPDVDWFVIEDIGEMDKVIVMGYELPTRRYTGSKLEHWVYWGDPFNGAYLFKGGAIEALQHNSEHGMALTPVTKEFYEKKIGAVVYGKFDKRFNTIVKLGSCPYMSDKVREMFTKDKAEYIGKVMEIKIVSGYDKSIVCFSRIVDYDSKTITIAEV
jgi:hypothetical protein